MSKTKKKKCYKNEIENNNPDNLIIERHAHICDFSVLSERSLEENNEISEFMDNFDSSNLVDLADNSLPM